MFDNKKLQKPGIVSKVFIFLILMVTLLPILWMVLFSFKTSHEILLEPLAWPKEFSFKNYEEALRVVPFVTMLKNTFIILAISLPIELALALAASFAISRVSAVSLKRRNFVSTFFSTGFIVPVGCMLFPVYRMMLGIGLWDNLWGVILPFIGWSAPFSVTMMVNAFNRVPTSLEEAAVLDGCNVKQLFLKVMAPLVRPTTITVFIMNFLSIWNDYVFCRIMLNDNKLQTISLAAMFFKSRYGTDYAISSAGIILIMLPQLIFFLFMQKYIVAGVSAGSVKE